MVIGKAFSDEVFALVSHGRLQWETYFFRIKDSLVSYDCHLGFVVPKGFHAEQKFKENYANRPDVNFARYMWVLQVEAFRGLVPVGANALTCQLYFILSLVKRFAKPKIRNFHFAIMKNDILGLQVVMDYPLFLVVKVLNAREDLRDDQLSFFLLDLFIFL